MVYLFVGQDAPAKNIKLKSLKQEYLAKETAQFNFDILYAKELNLLSLQERLLSLPVKAKKRMVLIKDAQELKEVVKNFILKYVKTPEPKIILILDIDYASLKQKDKTGRIKSSDEFIRQLARHAKIYRFREPVPLDTFTLNRQIELKRTDYALKILSQLLQNGERPERILGGLRYSCQRNFAAALETRKNIRLLLDCDLDIKTGRLKPGFALEKLVVRLCSS
ncbi:MAG: hypothetical protein KKH29_05095 [Candidatus Omnitrophica bacterium]|nr:hypothetical protein [Candidatus Omnitrophota bacterium]MBU4346681.1 hypothetical protein [Candidatus Omnitrophota bacterium]MBU4473486.1 hypothetical protein [Candidatus Omnitrophota bacterium]MCG2706919.1 hypothetical protein [Candidatus Omnitrophota bacterium]